ncbi:MAG: site-specific integrase [Saprospiraceae bacterium]
MRRSFPTTAIYFNRWVPNKEGKCPLSLKVTYNRKRRYYSTEFALTPEEYEKVIVDKPKGVFKDIANDLHREEIKAIEIIRQLPMFTFESFEKRFFSNMGANHTLKNAYAMKIQGLKENSRLGTVVTYECGIASLEKFQPGATFAHVQQNFLDKYEAWMAAKGNSKTTVSIYVRTLRSIFNDAIAEGMISKDLYPFGKRKYEVPSGRNIKKALSIEEIALIFNYQAAPGSEEMARDYWLFLYLANGMNVKDMALLKYSNIKGEFIEYERAKTKNTKRDYEPIQVYLLPHLQNLIAKHGNKKKGSDEFIFPILEKNLTPDRQKELISLKVHVINHWMKAIAKNLGIEKQVTTYFARHSFATVLKRSGLSKEFIGDSLGHSSNSTTERYLGSFEDSRKKDAAQTLLDFSANKHISPDRKELAT